MKCYWVFLVILTLILSCGANDKPDLVLKYKELPLDVRNKFKYVYDYEELVKMNHQKDTIGWYSPPFAECYDLNRECECKLESKGGIIRNPFFSIESCDKSSKISWAILQRVFIIKNDTIYYPFSRSASTTTGEPRSFNVKIDTLEFHGKKMK